MTKIYFLILFGMCGNAFQHLFLFAIKINLATIFVSEEDITFATSTSFHSIDNLFSVSNARMMRNYKNLTEVQNYIVQSCNYVIIDKDFTSFKNTVDNLLNENNLQVDGKYLLLIQELSVNETSSFFATLWKYEVYNVVIRNKDDYYTWYPYEKCHDIKPTPTNLFNGFTNKIPKKLNCSFRVDWAPSSVIVKNPFDKYDPGIFILYANELAKCMGATFAYLKNNVDFTKQATANISFDMAEAMDKDNIVMAVGGFGYFFSLQNQKIQFSGFISPLENFLVLPPRKTRPKWKAFLKFDNLTLVLVIAVIFLNSLLISVRAKIWLRDALMLSFQLFIQLTIPLKPRKLSSKVFFLSVILFSMFINFIYMSMLSGVFTRPNYEPDITNMLDFSKTDIPLKCVQWFFDGWLHDLDQDTKNRLLKKHIATRQRGLEQVLVFLNRSDHAIFSTPLHLYYVKNTERLPKIKSLGVVLYVLVCGSLPFDGRTLHDLRNVVIEGKFRIPYFMSQDCEYLIRHMLVVDPEKRLTMTQIAKHRWLANTPPVDTGPERELQLNKTVIDHMLQLPNLNQNMVLQSLKNNTFDHIHAIYNLLLDKLHQRTINFQSKISQQRRVGNEEIGDYLHTRPPKINERSESFNEQQLVTHLAGEASQGAERQVDESFNYRRESFNENCLRREEVKERRKSMNESISEDGGSPFVSMPTIPAVYLVNDGENQPLEKFKEMDQDASEEACSLSVPSSSTTGYGSCSSSGDKYLTVRRHTVGPGDSAHEQVLETHYMAQAQQDPNGTKLLPHTNLPLHLPILGQQNPHYFGGKDPHLLKPPTVLNAAGGFGRRASDGGANLHMAWGTPGSHEQLSMMSTSSSGNPSLSSGTVTQPLEQPALDELAAVARYMQGRGNAKRHTMANTEEVHSLQSASGSGVRTRRTGLLTVMERPPVIPPELVMEVEARMKRNHMPSMLSQRKHSRHPVKPHLPTVQELQGREPKSMERFSPVRRGSEGSASGSRTLSPSTPQQECQRLQRGLQARSSPPRSIPGSPIHQLVSDSQIRHPITECPSPIHQFYTTDPSLGPSPESYQSSFANSPLHSSPFGTNPNSNLNSPIQQNLFGQVPNLTMYSGTNSPIMNPLLSPSTSPVFGSFVPTPTAPGSISSITQGISGLNTTGTGSITQGTPSTSLQLEIRNQQMQDDKMDTSYSSLAGFQPNFLHQSHHMHHILNIHNHRSLTNSPISNPGSPGLDMIQEELPHMHSVAKNDQQNVGHPQISVTDVLGSEVTLVAGSDTSEDSMDSLDNQKIPKIPSFVISEPSENLPSITKGIGRKTSQENEEPAKFCSKPQETEAQESEFFLRRNSDKSSVYSDDSLSNDSLSIGNQSPSSSSNTQSSHACDSDIRLRPVDNNYEKMQISQELTNSGAGNFQIFQNYRLSEEFHDTNLHKNSGSFEFELSEVCSKLQSTDILEMVKRTINDQIPPKTYSSSENVGDRLSLEYEGGIQIELKVIDKQKDSKGLKMRRISGDHLVYNQLCQQLISCMTVS